jgi:penicillin-binding protein 1A
MKVATKGDKAEWFDRPANVIGVNVCRTSGKLPNAGCNSVPSTDDYGNLVIKSNVYTDYFVKGTQPTSLCPVHTSASIDAIAASDTSSGSHAPPAIGAAADRAGLPLPPAQGTSGMTPPPAPGAPITGGKVEEDEKPQQKKRGFWSRLFGRGKSDDQKKDDDKKKAEEKRKKPGGGQ